MHFLVMSDLACNDCGRDRFQKGEYIWFRDSNGCSEVYCEECALPEDTPAIVRKLVEISIN